MAERPRLSCEEVFARLDDYLDRELAAEDMALVREHLETCAICAAEHRFERHVIDDLRSKLRRIRAPEPLTARITALLR